MAIERPPINQLPRGLLGFLGIKTGGRYPSQLLEQVQPTLDLLYWYGHANAQYVSFGQIALGPGATDADAVFVPWVSATPSIPVVVPGNETWLITEATLRMTFNAVAGGVVHGAVLASTFQTSLNVRTWPMTFSRPEALSSNANYGVGSYATLNRPILLNPGEAVGFAHGGFELGAGGNLFANGSMTLLRLF
jgi:hypothetical protein